MMCRDNVLLWCNASEARYQAALAACALDTDLAHMGRGDATSCGTRGSAVSGGQAARIALARALCQVASNAAAANAPILPLSKNRCTPFTLAHARLKPPSSAKGKSDAACLVQDAEVMLLDNVFAAVDGGTAAQLVEALQGPLGAGRTRIVVSNHAPLLAAADVVVTLELGRVRSIGA